MCWWDVKLKFTHLLNQTFVESVSSCINVWKAIFSLLLSSDENSADDENDDDGDDENDSNDDDVRELDENEVNKRLEESMEAIETEDSSHDGGADGQGRDVPNIRLQKRDIPNES